MVNLYPASLEEIKRVKTEIPNSEIKFIDMLEGLGDDWHVWHSVNWDSDIQSLSGEADFLLFNAKYGFVVMEVKGGIISIEQGDYFSSNQLTFEKSRIRNPFKQAEKCMYHIRDYYTAKANEQPNPSEFLKERDLFPLNFDYAVFFSDTPFKDDFESIQNRHFRVFDSIDYDLQLDFINQKSTEKVSPLEVFLIELLEHHRKKRVILNKVEEFFPQIIGTNMTKYVCLKKYFEVREKELEKINQVQDFLLAALSEKKKCIFKGSAGSGKTFIAMKKAIINYNNGLKTLFLCFNTELRESVKSFLSERLGIEPWRLEDHLAVYSIHLFLLNILTKLPANDKTALFQDLKQFYYKNIAQELKEHSEWITQEYKYDAIIVDEAQDIDESVWDLFPNFLKHPEESIFYVFYDEGQAIFVKDFSPARFGMDPNSDLILLSKNLRNSIEIARWIEERTQLGKYNEYSGINGFKIKRKRLPSTQQAIISILNTIKKGYLAKNIHPNQIIVLSYYTLSKMLSKVMKNKFGDYISLKSSSLDNKKVVLCELNKLSDLVDLQRISRNDWIIPLKTITSFKGLERDIVFLLIPNMEDFKEIHPERYENFIKQIYVGASRAKFKLDIVEFNITE